MARFYTVASKLPFPLELRLFDMVDVDEQTPSGPKATKRARERLTEKVIIKGNALFAPGDANHANNPVLIGGYCLTHNVPAEHWETWVSQNRQNDLVRNSLVFGYEKPDHAVAKARELEGLRTGFERLDPSDLIHDERVISGVGRLGAARLSTADANKV